MSLFAPPSARGRVLGCLVALFTTVDLSSGAPVSDDFSTTNNLYTFGNAISLTASNNILTAERTTGDVDTGFDWRVGWFFSLAANDEQSQFQITAVQPLQSGFFVLSALVFSNENYLGEFTIQGDLNSTGTFGYDIAAAAIQAGWTNANQWFPRIRITPFGSSDAGFEFADFGAVDTATTSVNSGTLTVDSTTSLGSGPITLSNGAQLLFLNNRAISNTINSGADSSGLINAEPGRTITYQGEISLGTASTMVFAGAGATHDLTGGIAGPSGSSLGIDGTTVKLTGTADYGGGTFVYGGGNLVANGSLTNSTVTVSDGGTLTGAGAVGTTIVLDGGTISPGNSPGALQINGDLIWNNGGSYDWEIFNLAGDPGTGWDVINVSGALDLTDLTGSPLFHINLFSLSGTNTTGPLAGFDNASNYSWEIVSAGSIALTGEFNPAVFNINSSGFTTYNPVAGIFALELRDGNSLYLTYTTAQPVPETSTWIAATFLLGITLWHGLRRRKRHT